MAGKEEDGYVLYHADPSGTYVRYEAKAIGSGSEGAQGLLQEKYSKDLTLEDALTLAVTVLKQVRSHSIHILPAYRMVTCILVAVHAFVVHNSALMPIICTCHTPDRRFT